MAQPDPGFKPYDTLKNKTFGGFLIAEFLAAFNDQCIHASAMFFVIHRHVMSEGTAISLMPILFYAPWAIFCTMSGYCADHFSKRSNLIFWKVAEVGITGLALLGFWIGTFADPTAHVVGAMIVLSCVFLMGTHSAFYVPNKYGVLPEIFEPHLLSKANGLVESTSFLAVILGTVTGGVLSGLFRGQEYWIGVVLVILALIGTLTSLLIARMPPADPQRPFPGWSPLRLYRPLVDNLKVLLRSRALGLAVLGIAFFTFMVAFMRQTMYMHGESQNPRWLEMEISMVVATLALGIGMGSPLAGFLSGGKVELGLVPLGATGMILVTFIAGSFLHSTPTLVACLFFLGFFAGFYIVPLYSLLTHRAPKGSKGASVATSNFINVTGAITASILFFVLVHLARFAGMSEPVDNKDVFSGKFERVAKEGTWQRQVAFVVVEDKHPYRTLEIKANSGVVTKRNATQEVEEHFIEVEGVWYPLEELFPLDEDANVIQVDDGLEKGVPVVVSKHVIRGVEYWNVRDARTPLKPIYNSEDLPRYLFYGAALMTLTILILLCRKLPDFFVRSLLWLRSHGRFHIKVVGVHHMPTDTAAILVTNCHHFDDAMHVLACTDRTVRFLLSEQPGDPGEHSALLRLLAKRTGLIDLKVGATTPADRDRAARAGLQSLQNGHLVAISADKVGAHPVPNDDYEYILMQLQKGIEVPIVPVYCGVLGPVDGDAAKNPKALRRIQVVIGHPMPAKSSAEDVREAINQLGHWLREKTADTLDPALASVMIPGLSSALRSKLAEGPPPPPSPG